VAADRAPRAAGAARGPGGAARPNGASKSAGAAKPGDRTVASNRRATHEFFIDERFEAGIVLSGSEIKSLRAGQASLAEAYVRVDEHGEAWLVGAHIAGYAQGGYANHEPVRRRKLLLRRRQLDELARKVKTKGVTIVPLRLYLARGWAKVEIGLARGKQLHDKRDAIRERDQRRDVDRALAQVRR